MCMVFVLFDVFYVKMRKTNKESYKKKKKKNCCTQQKDQILPSAVLT